MLRQKDRQTVVSEPIKDDGSAPLNGMQSGGVSSNSSILEEKRLVTDPESIQSPSSVTLEPALSESMWKILLKQLTQLCSDPRPEVRNGACQSIFRTVSLNGSRLNLEAWKECINQIMFPLLEHIQLSSDRADNTKSSSSAVSEIRGSVSGSPLVGSPIGPVVGRNTVTKQWDETKVLTLQGFAKCFIDFQDVLVGLGDERVGDVIKSAISTTTKDPVGVPKPPLLPSPNSLVCRL